MQKSGTPDCPVSYLLQELSELRRVPLNRELLCRSPSPRGL